ncbi:MAG: hypothetical protein RLZ25_1425 [Pseudomonadota bacterium]|jgi:pilus assembly protein CpaF
MSLRSRLESLGSVSPLESASTSLTTGKHAGSHIPPLYELILEPPRNETTYVETVRWVALRDDEKEWEYRIYEEVVSMLDMASINQLEFEVASEQVRSLTEKLFNDYKVPLNSRVRQLIAKNIEHELFGYGPLEQLMNDQEVSDILVNGARKIFVERQGKLEKTPIRFKDDAHLMKIIDKIVSAVGRRVDESVPMVDARLPDGSRFNAIIPPVALDGPTVSIRRFPSSRLTMQDLIRYQTLTPDIASVLAAAVKAKVNILISGGTGSGKTTLLNVLSNFIGQSERVITIEDAAELQLQQAHVVRLETKPSNIEGRGAITQRDLVKNALRMRPERIILGEVRGDEAFDMLQAMNTGHEGSLGTVHANTPRDCLARFENMIAMSGMDLPTRMVRQQIASAIDLVVQVSRLEDGQRKILSVSEICGMEGEIITMSDIFSFKRKGIDENGLVKGTIEPTGIIPFFYEKIRLCGIDIPPEVFAPVSEPEVGAP